MEIIYYLCYSGREIKSMGDYTCTAVGLQSHLAKYYLNCSEDSIHIYIYIYISTYFVRKQRLETKHKVPFPSDTAGSSI